MNAQTVPSILIMSHYAIHCEVLTHGKRLLDQLNDSESGYVNVDGGRFFQRQEEKPIVHEGTMLVAKASVHLAMPVDKTTDPSKLFFATIDRRRFPATVALPTAIVQGTVQAKIGKDPRSFLAIDAGPFFPVTGATIFHSAAAESLQCPVVLVSKAHLSSLAFGS